MTAAAFFGYGSLVNRRTHAYPAARPARLRGWRRVWCDLPTRREAFLSVEPAAESEISGLVAEVPQGDWAALDQREAGYRRLPINGGLAQTPPLREAVQIYAIEAGRAAGQAEGPILLSYLDAVVQGFLAEFGSDGATHFFATTVGWRAVVDDRAAPAYPRAQALDPADRAVVDAAVAQLGLQRISA